MWEQRAYKGTRWTRKKYQGWTCFRNDLTPHQMAQFDLIIIFVRWFTSNRFILTIFVNKNLCSKNKKNNRTTLFRESSPIWFGCVWILMMLTAALILRGQMAYQIHQRYRVGFYEPCVGLRHKKNLQTMLTKTNTTDAFL